MLILTPAAQSFWKNRVLFYFRNRNYIFFSAVNKRSDYSQIVLIIS